MDNPTRRRVSFALLPPRTTTTTTTPRRTIIPTAAGDAWGNNNNEYLVDDDEPPAPPVAAAASALPQRLAPRPPHVSLAPAQPVPTLRALCLTTLAQHTFLLAGVAIDESQDPDVLRRALPCSNDRLALAAAARRRGELSPTLFLALADPCWPVLCLGVDGQPGSQAVIEAARQGLLKGVRAVEWVLPSSSQGATTPTTPTTPATPTPTQPTVLLPSEASAVVRSLAAHCESLESLSLRRADPARPTRPAVAAALAKALLAAALPKGLVVVGGRRRSSDKEEEEEEEASKEQAAASAVAESWEDALQHQAPTNRETFALPFRLLQWEDLPDAAADAMAARCPRIALDRKRRQQRTTTSTDADLDYQWIAALLAPGWDDRAALLQERREEERARRKAARAKGLPVVVVVDDEAEEDDDGGADDLDDNDNDATKQQQQRAAAAAAAAPNNNNDSDSDDDAEDQSIAARFRRAYLARAERLKAVERAKEATARRRAVRASPAAQLVERWLDEPV